jgi:phage gpG-like protein
MQVRSKVTLDGKALKALRDGLKAAGKAEVQVGVFAYDADRDDEGSDMSNADIGAVHEFGSKARNIPERSFLRMPTETKLPKELKRIGATIITKTIIEKGASEFLREVGQIAEGQIDEAFTTSGYGQWAPNSKRTERRKGSARPLIDTGKLRAAITSRVEKKGAKS